MSQTITKKTKPIVKKPKLFEVILLNDDYTTMEFVIEILKIIFKKNAIAAEAIMLKIHIEGESICGTYSYDIAQTKVNQVIDFARKNNQPLMCILREIKN